MGRYNQGGVIFQCLRYYENKTSPDVKKARSAVLVIMCFPCLLNNLS